ncbi:MAG: M23 family metallopeptidase [bacterium]
MAKQLRIFLFFSLTVCLLLSSCTIFKWTVPKEEKIKPSKITFIWPIKGEISSGFGKRGGGFHQGIDIKAEEGSLIKAAADGIVSYADFRPTYGNVIIILHKDGFATVYAHNKKNLVSVSQRVKQGDVIALVGKTGNATGFHLHFEIRNKGKAENPLIYLQMR